MYGVRKCSNFILLHIAVPVSPAPFNEEAVLAPLLPFWNICFHIFLTGMIACITWGFPSNVYMIRSK